MQRMITAVTIKMPAMPFPIMGSVLRNALKFKDMLYPPLSEQIQDQAARNDGCDLTGNIDADRRHEQEVLRILRAAQLMHDTRRHRECRDTGSANHGVDLAVFRQEQIQDLRKDDAARRIKNERDKAEPQDEERLGGQKVLRLHLGRNRDSKEQRDEVCEHLLRCFGQRIQHAALADQIPEHQEADQCNAARGNNARNDSDRDREQKSS